MNLGDELQPQHSCSHFSLFQASAFIHKEDVCLLLDGILIATNYRKVDN